MAITYTKAPNSPAATNMGEFTGTKITGAQFNGAVQSTTKVYLGGKQRVATLPKAQYSVQGIVIGGQAGGAELIPQLGAVAAGTDFETNTVTIGENQYENAIWTGSAISTQDVGDGYKLLALTKIYTILGDITV